jgi:rod shape determining protein RodA
MGINERYHTRLSFQSVTGGGMTGQGLFQGTRTQTPGALYAQHTDYIFSAIGEELGYMGCALVIIMLLALVIRCIWVGSKSPDYMRRMVCFGAAAALMFQIIINVGMCMGIMPVIGLTLPLISYGGSSVVTIYAMLGLVSGVHARPSPRSHERYIRPPR